MCPTGQAMTSPANDLVEILPDGRMRLHFHKGQWKAWISQARWILLLAGTQGGKTSFGPHWLHREIRDKGPGDYLVVTPSFPLLDKKALPEFRGLFEDRLTLGNYKESAKTFAFSPFGTKKLWGYEPASVAPTKVFFGYAAEPDSLESATAKAVWADEAGQKKFKLGSWQAIQRRLSLNMGRGLITTTPYYLGWLKTELWDKRHTDPTIEVIRFESIMNPRFPKAEYERAKRDLPDWKFNLFYRAIFTKPAGLIYDAFDEKRHTIPRFAIPDNWPRYMGLDFGGLHTAALFYAQKPGTQQFFLYREYLAGNRTAEEHVKAMLANEPKIPICVGGSKSEDQWRREFQAAGLPVDAPRISDVEVGIDRVYGAHKRDEILVFSDLAGYLDEKASYSRELDDNDEPTEKIEDKDSYHFMDAERYIIGKLVGPPEAVESLPSIWD